MQYRLFLLIFIIPLALSAQRFQGGVMAGMSGAQVDGDTYAGFNHIGLQGGAFVKTKFSDWVGSQMEIRYISKGARENKQEPDPLFYKLNLRYVEVPVLLNIYFNEDIFAEIGLSPALLMSKSKEDENGVLPKDQFDDYKKFDLGGALGFNYQFTDRFIANIRYTYSLITIREHITDDNYYYSIMAKILGYDQGDYNNVLTLGVYYLIGK